MDSVQYRVALPGCRASASPSWCRRWGWEGRPAHRRRFRAAPSPSPPRSPGWYCATRWQALRAKANADKRVAIVHYNPIRRAGRTLAPTNPDARLALPSSRACKAEGADTGETPHPRGAPRRIMARGVNLPEDKAALAWLPRGGRVSAADYKAWFAGLPWRVRGETVSGPCRAAMPRC